MVGDRKFQSQMEDIKKYAQLQKQVELLEDVEAALKQAKKDREDPRKQFGSAEKKFKRGRVWLRIFNNLEEYVRLQTELMTTMRNMQTAVLNEIRRCAPELVPDRYR